MKKLIPMFFSAFLVVVAASGCSSAPPVKAEAYAQLKNHRTFENDFPAVWKAIEETFRNYKVTERDPKEVTPLELKKLERRTLKTEWTYGKSRDKYQEYTVNDTPRKVFLQERMRFTLDAHRVMGGVEVMVNTEEEVERLKKDGSSDGYHETDQPDPSRADEILNKIANQLLAAPAATEAE